MVVPSTIDDDLFIIEHVFSAALSGAEAKYGPLDREVARELVFELKRRRRGGRNFAEVKSQLVLDTIEVEHLRSRYHSFLTRYFKGEKHTPSGDKTRKTLVTDERLLKYLRGHIVQERSMLDQASGEDIISPDGVDYNRSTEPEYEGPIWDD